MATNEKIVGMGVTLYERQIGVLERIERALGLSAY